MHKVSFWFLAVVLLLTAGCGGVVGKSYVKQDGPWDVIQRVAIFPFDTPSENPVRRNLITQLFSQELRRAGLEEVVEIPLSDPRGAAPDLQYVATEYLVDGVFFGSVDQTTGTVVHIRLLDSTTSDVLWSGTYMLTARAEFLSLKTQQQRYQRAFSYLVGRLQRETGIGLSP